MLIERTLKRHRLYGVFIYTLCLAVVVPGCDGCRKADPVVKERRPSEKRDEFLSSLLTDIEDEEKKLEKSGQEKPADIKAAASKVAEDISSYETFKDKFENETGRDWDDFLSSYENNKASFENRRIEIPNTSDATRLLEDVLVTATGESKKEVQDIKQNLEDFSKVAKQAKEEVEEIATQAKSTFTAIDDVVNKVESLEGKSVEQAKATLEELAATSLPELVGGVTSLSKNGDFIKATKEAGKHLKTIEKVQEELGKAKGVVEKLKDKGVLDGDTADKVTSVIENVDSTANDISSAYNSMAAMSMMATQLAPVIAANPYVGLAIMALMVLMAIFSDGGGGEGDGEGEGTGNGDGDGDGTPAGGTTGEPSDPGNNEQPNGSGGGTKGDESVGDEIKTEIAKQGLVKGLEDVGPVGSIGSKDGGDIAYEAGWRKDEAGKDQLVFMIYFDGTGNSGTEFVIKEYDSTWKTFTDPLLEAKDGKRNINVQSVEKSGEVVTLKLSGFDGGTSATFQQDGDNPPTVNN